MYKISIPINSDGVDSKIVPVLVGDQNIGYCHISVTGYKVFGEMTLDTDIQLYNYEKHFQVVGGKLTQIILVKTA